MVTGDTVLSAIVPSEVCNCLKAPRFGQKRRNVFHEDNFIPHAL